MSWGSDDEEYIESESSGDELTWDIEKMERKSKKRQIDSRLNIRSNWEKWFFFFSKQKIWIKKVGFSPLLF